MGMIKRALRRTSRKLLSKIIPPAHSHQLVLNPPCVTPLGPHADQLSKRKLASLQRKLRKSSSKDTAVAEALLLAVKNHLPPLQFHHIHGPHAQLSSNRCVARRTQSFCQALVFSNRVILPNERVYIKVLDISKCWSGTIRFGFTAVDPATLACRMPKHACPDMTNGGHTWARALADEVVRRNSVIHFSYNKSGVIHYGINNQDCGIFHANVGTNQNLWFIVDIYGLTAAVELIDPRVNSAPNNGLNFPHIDEELAAGQQDRSTMFKSTSAMDELFGSPCGSAWSSSRRKKQSRKYARHAALMQGPNWPLENYPGAVVPSLAFGQHPLCQLNQGRAMQLPNLNSVTLPSAQQNIYSPMPSQPASEQARARNEPHDYHQIMSNAHTSSSFQPVQVCAAAPKMTGPISMASGAPTATSSSSNRHGAPSTSQVDLCQQLDNIHLSRARKQSPASKGVKSASACLAGPHQTPVAATRRRQENVPQTNARRTSETARDQADKSGSSALAHQRIVSASKSAASSTSATTAKAATSVKPRTRQSVKNPKSTTARDIDDNNTQGKDCPICFERPINCVLYQCGHMCTCYECGVKQWKTQSRTCPICRTVIKDVIKTYMS